MPRYRLGHLNPREGLLRSAGPPLTPLYWGAENEMENRMGIDCDYCERYIIKIDVQSATIDALEAKLERLENAMQGALLCDTVVQMYECLEAALEGEQGGD